MIINSFFYEIAVWWIVFLVLRFRKNRKQIKLASSKELSIWWNNHLSGSTLFNALFLIVICILMPMRHLSVWLVLHYLILLFAFFEVKKAEQKL